MRKIIPLLLVINLSAFNCIAQFYIEPVIGYQIDMNNSPFKQINSAVQFTFKKSRKFELSFKLERSWPVSVISFDSAFTANPSLPLYTIAKKTILPGAFTFSAVNRFAVYGIHTSNIFFVLVSSGFTAQKIRISYQYDKNDYTILNPDKTQDRVSLFLSCGVEYMRLLKNGRLFFQLNVCTPPAGKSIKYPLSFKFMAPLNFNTGYSIPIKKSAR